MQLKRLRMIWVWLFLYSPFVAFSDPVSYEHIEVELISQFPAVEPGKPFWVAVRLTPEKDWKIYWRNPGDSGLPTHLQWNIPKEAKQAETLWPYPERVEFQGIVIYGYGNEAVLLTQITPPESLDSMEAFPLTASLSWLICNDVCIQGNSTLSLNLPVSRTTTSENLVWADLMASAQRRLPLRLEAVNSGYAVNDGHLELYVEFEDSILSDAVRVVYFPEQLDVVTSSSLLDTKWTDHRFQLRQTLSEYFEGVEDPLRGVLVVHTAESKKAYAIETPPRPLIEVSKTSAFQPTPPTENSLVGVVFMAMLGGLLLNLMPCVFPVLSLKAISLVQASGLSCRAHRIHGIAYTLGVMTFFCAVAGILYLLKAGGAMVGWGFQLQTPWFVALLAYLLFILGLGFSGLLQIGAGTMGIGQTLTQRKGYMGSFLTGALAAVVASPCTAPFMGTAIAYAIVQPPLHSLLVFLALAFGMALPFLVIAFIPNIGRYLPKPGLWMDVFKQAMAFPLYLTAIWLLWVLGRETDITVMAIVLIGMLLLIFALWLKNIQLVPKSRWRHAKGMLSLAAIAGSLVLVGVPGLTGTTASTENVLQDTFWEQYSEERMAELRSQNRPVFLNITADWCISCIANERVALSMGSVRSAFKEKNIAPLKGDWTNNDPKITKVLESFNRNGVPLYILYPPGDNADPILLPQWLTPGNVLSALESI